LTNEGHVDSRFEVLSQLVVSAPETSKPIDRELQLRLRSIHLQLKFWLLTLMCGDMFLKGQTRQFGFHSGLGTSPLKSIVFLLGRCPYPSM
jgi:hypothetical protein